MKVFYILLAGLMAVAVNAQQGPGMPGGNGPGAGPGGASAEPRTFIDSAEIASRIAAADAAAKAGTQYRPDPMLQSGPFRGGMEIHTEGATSFAAHMNDAELFVVLDGSGTMTMGGKLVNPTQRGTNMTAATVDGATAHKLVKGDMLLVPEGTPHAVTQVDGRLIMMSMHLPLPAPATGPAAAPATGPSR